KRCSRKIQTSDRASAGSGGSPSRHRWRLRSIAATSNLPNPSQASVQAFQTRLKRLLRDIFVPPPSSRVRTGQRCGLCPERFEFLSHKKKRKSSPALSFLGPKIFQT